MAGRDEWLDLAIEIGGRLDSPKFRVLYGYAREDGRRVLGRFSRLGAADKEDIVHAVLARALTEILAAENPRAFFLACVAREAISWLRKHNMRRAVPLDEPGVEKAAAVSGAADASIELSEVLALLDGVAPRDVSVFVAIRIHGADREDLARIHSTTRANIDQIVSRVQRSLRRGRS